MFWLSKQKRYKYNGNDVDFKHNQWRINNDLGWIFSDGKCTLKDIDIYRLYWFDIELKNLCFPWVFKLERELKSMFIYYYKQIYQNEINHLLEGSNYNWNLKNAKNKIPSHISQLKATKKKQNNKNQTIDNFIFVLTFGEFVSTLRFFNSSIVDQIANQFEMKANVFVSALQLLNVVRNTIAHNKTILDVSDKNSNRSMCLVKDVFNFNIDKKDCDYISTKAGGVIYIVARMLNKSGLNKSKYFIKNVIKLTKKTKSLFTNKADFDKVIYKLFSKHEKDILHI